MNNSKQPMHQRSWWNRPTTWLIALVLPSTLILAAFLFREWSARNEVDRRLAEMRQSGKPIDNASMELRFVASTSSQGTLAWSEVAYAASGWGSTMGQDLPYFGSISTPSSAFVDGTWPQAERVQEFLAEMEPFIQRLHETADQTSGPVWQPIHFNGFSTLLGSIQEARSISRLLALDFDYAVFVKDRQRALRDLKSHKAAITAYRWDTFLVQELVSLAMTGMMHASIGRSLQSDLWTEEDLIELKRLIGPPADVASRWRKTNEFELAAALASIESGSDLGFGPEPLDQALRTLTKLPSSRLRFLDEMQQVIALGQNDFESLLKAAESFDTYKQRGLIASLVAGWVPGIARAFINSEESRRLLLTAIAVKQHRIKHGIFPSSLDELLLDTNAELTRAELEGVDHSPMGYKLEGSIALLWNTRPASGKLDKITTQPPEISENGLPERHHGLVIGLR